ncbi:MAG: DUF4238 domain-containing protein [Parcubacteria group bacterium]
MPTLIGWFYFSLKFTLRYEFDTVRGISKSEKNRHHHVPQFLLKNFKTKKGLIYKRNKTTFKSIRCSIKKQSGCIDGQFFLTNVKTKKKDQIIEDFYGCIENKACPIVKKLLNNNLSDINNFELNMLAHFISSLVVRNLVFREFIAMSLSYVADKFYGGKSKKIDRKFIVDIFIKNAYNLNKEILNEWASFYDDNKNEKLLNNSMILSNYLLGYIAENIFSYNISIFDISSSNYFFIISDNPVLFSDNNMIPKILFFPPIIFDNDTMVVLPISPQKCIVLSRVYKNKATYNPEKEIIKRINALSLINSPQYTYSDREESYFIDLFTK